MSWMGGGLIQLLPWSRLSTYRCIVNQYTEYVTPIKYRDSLVFEVYDSTYTKDMAKQRRSKINSGTTVIFIGGTPVKMKKDKFLAIRQNKQLFMFMLGEELTKKNCR